MSQPMLQLISYLRLHSTVMTRVYAYSIPKFCDVLCETNAICHDIYYIRLNTPKSVGLVHRKLYGSKSGRKYCRHERNEI